MAPKLTAAATLNPSPVINLLGNFDPDVIRLPSFRPLFFRIPAAWTNSLLDPFDRPTLWFFRAAIPTRGHDDQWNGISGEEAKDREVSVHVWQKLWIIYTRASRTTRTFLATTGSHSGLYTRDLAIAIPVRVVREILLGFFFSSLRFDIASGAYCIETQQFSPLKNPPNLYIGLRIFLEEEEEEEEEESIKCLSFQVYE
ncbi:hypothetical protein K435DRAFT_834564 [Dendrothele bispora CBS 962.96]|uniref:Uncharacterized protein n=1 Tax=Dendrothele bispora (strain CBS 962.96) TaxID=1314807 RepID=A0A4S8MRY7_DENBC|nr:hypothetical protein K435DRAFT_834564 [Dendrothele bispora CBS 962.96]